VDDPEEDAPRKRQKVQTALEEVFNLAVESVGQEKLFALQVVFFLLDQPRHIEQKYLQKMTKVLPNLSQEDSNVQTWVFLVFARYVMA
jgi:hypothetical protein